MKYVLSTSLVLGMLLLLYYSIAPPKPVPPKPVPKPNVQKKIENLNLKLIYLNVEQSRDIFITGENPTFQYKIRIKENAEGVYFFKLGKYDELTTDEPNLLYTNDYCEIFEALGTFDNPLLKAIKDNLEINAKFELGMFSFEIPNIESLILELLYIFYELEKIEADRIQVLVRGHADKASSTWKGYLKSYPYNYTQINMKPIESTEIGRNFYKNYQAKDSTFKINSSFSNLELAYLRAKYIEEDVLGRTIGSGDCEIVPDEISILQGKEYPNIENENLRRVDVFINFYFKK